MTDRFGPIPVQVVELLNAIRLQWIALSLCFEKITLKKNVLRGYFPANPSSGFYESAKFQAIISYVQHNPYGIKLKENKSVLILQLDQIHSLSAAINTLEKINQKN